MRDFGRQALGELLAEIEHDDAVRQAHDRLHQVLDHQDGHAALADAADDADHVLDLGRVEAGQHLVEQQQQRPRGQRAGEFEPLLAGDGQVHRQHLGAIVEADDRDRLARRLAGAAPSGRFSRPKQAPTVQFSSTVMLVSGCTI